VLIAAHAKGVIHRDIKPENVFVSRTGQVKVLDFGIARLREVTSKSTATVSGATMGTPAFMPPVWAGTEAGAIGWGGVHSGVPLRRAAFATSRRSTRSSVLANRPGLDLAVGGEVVRAFRIGTRHLDVLPTGTKGAGAGNDFVPSTIDQPGLV
jgi:hypothetical protein